MMDARNAELEPGLAGEGVAVAGKNCWRKAPARRVAFLIDAEAYFEALAAALERAERSILIAGWDFDSRLCLRRNPAPGQAAEGLGQFLNRLVRRRRRLRAHVLIWDFAMVFALDREFLPLFKADWRPHRRLKFRFDSEHPVGASLHQKIVVIDNALAFVGGLDLTARRWDTPAHLPQDPRRVDPRGEPFAPVHDVQCAVDGEAAAALAELVRERWYRATRKRLNPIQAGRDPWPASLRPDLEDVSVAIARTDPGNPQGPVHEVEALHLDAIATARRYIYIENQYLTSAGISQALTARLQEESGPEVVVVGPREVPGWMEQSTMGALRSLVVRQLRESDRFNRLRVFYPAVAGAQGPSVFVHAKVMVVDDRLVRVGSANLSNRSMRLDTECDLVIEAEGRDPVQRVIAGFRDRLLGEHLGRKPEEVRGAEAAAGSLVKAIDRLRIGERTLAPLPEEVSDWVSELISESDIIDPEEPIQLGDVVDYLLPEETQAPGLRRRIFAWSITLLTLAALAAAWRWTPLHDLFQPGEWLEEARPFADSIWAPLTVIAAYLAGSLLLFSMTVMVLLTGLIFPFWKSLAYALLGAMLSALALYGLGQRLSRETVRKLAGKRLNRISRRLARPGSLAIAGIRIWPIAPFSVVSLVAGVSRVSFRDYLVGTFFGIIPGIMAVTFFASRMGNVIEDPSVFNVMILFLMIGIAATLAVYLKRRAKRS